MRSKLSQGRSPTARAADDGPARTRVGASGGAATGLASLTVAIALLAVGCERGFLSEHVYGKPLASSEIEIETSTAVSTPPSSEPATTFEWPARPDHPILRVEIEGAAGEGTIEIELMPDLAPTTVAQLLEWAESGFYDGTTFHRVIDGFMIQGGDPRSRDRNPRNDGTGGPGFALDDEFSSAPFVRGVVGMGNKGRANSTGSQFFIVQQDQPSLAGRYTAVGRVRRGMELVDAIARVETDKVGRWGPRDRPIENVVMKKVVRVEPTELAASDAAPEAMRDPQASATP